MARGADYAWASVAPSSLHSAGVTFVVRYVSHDLSKLTLAPVAAIDEPAATERSRRAFTTKAGPPRKTTRSEVAGLLAAGINVAMVWEDTADAAAQGYSRGVSDAREADRQVNNLGLSGIVIYFAVDYDVPTGDQAQINAYFDGVASVIGKARTGIYGGYWPVERVRAAGKATYFWGTYAWSGSNWGSCGWSPHLMQQLAMVYIGGVQCDVDISSVADFGQYGGVPDPYATISEGASGAGVTAAQTRLNVWHASPAVVVDGAFGPATTTAVRQFQTAHTMTVDGVIGPATWTELNKTPVVPGQLPAPSWLAIDNQRVALTWGPVTGATGYTVRAYGTDGNTYANQDCTNHWCVLNGLRAGWTYDVHVWARGGTVAPEHASLTVTMPG